MRRSEFCQSRSLSFSTLTGKGQCVVSARQPADRNLKKLCWKRNRKPICSAGGLLPVELAARKSPKQDQSSCGLAVATPGGRRIEAHPEIEVHPDF